MAAVNGLAMYDKKTLLDAQIKEVASLKTRIRLDDAKTTDDEVKQRLLALDNPLLRLELVGDLVDKLPRA